MLVFLKTILNRLIFNMSDSFLIKRKDLLSHILGFIELK